MFNKVVVIGISKNIVRAAKINPGNKKISKALSLEYEGNALTEAFKIIRKKLRVKEARILLSDDVSYVLHTKIPADLSTSKFKTEREYAFGLLQEIVPEIIEESDWDYKITHSISDTDTSSHENDAVVFTPVKKYLDLIVRASQISKIKIQAIEPESIASLRDKDPLIGLALKTDLRGEDQDTLNLLPVASPQGEMAQQEQGKITIKKDKSTKRSKIYYLIIVILIFGISLPLYYFRSKIIPRVEDYLPSKSVPTQSPSPSSSASPVPTTEPNIEDSEDIYNYSIQVLNGSGIAGLAGEVQDLLIANGFSGVDVGNAESNDYEDTQIITKKPLPEATLNEIKNSLREYKTVELEDVNQEFDIVIILSQKQ